MPCIYVNYVYNEVQKDIKDNKSINNDNNDIFNYTNLTLFPSPKMSVIFVLKICFSCHIFC